MVTAFYVGMSLFLLHLTEASNQRLTRGLPTIRQRLQEEQDPVKLRQMANGLLDLDTEGNENQEMTLHLLVGSATVLGLLLFVYSLSTGIYAYRLQRESREKAPPTSS